MKDISEANDPVPHGSLATMHRAAALARKIAIQTGTDLIIVKDGKLTRVPPKDLIAAENAKGKSS